MPDGHLPCSGRIGIRRFKARPLRRFIMSVDVVPKNGFATVFEAQPNNVVSKVRVPWLSEDLAIWSSRQINALNYHLLPDTFTLSHYFYEIRPGCYWRILVNDSSPNVESSCTSSFDVLDFAIVEEVSIY